MPNKSFREHILKSQLLSPCIRQRKSPPSIDHTFYKFTVMINQSFMIRLSNLGICQELCVKVKTRNHLQVLYIEEIWSIIMICFKKIKEQSKRKGKPIKEEQHQWLLLLGVSVKTRFFLSNHSCGYGFVFVFCLNAENPYISWHWSDFLGFLLGKWVCYNRCLPLRCYSIPCIFCIRVVHWVQPSMDLIHTPAI